MRLLFVYGVVRVVALTIGILGILLGIATLAIGQGPRRLDWSGPCPCTEGNECCCGHCGDGCEGSIFAPCNCDFWCACNVVGTAAPAKAAGLNWANACRPAAVAAGKPAAGPCHCTIGHGCACGCGGFPCNCGPACTCVREPWSPRTKRATDGGPDWYAGSDGYWYRQLPARAVTPAPAQVYWPPAAYGGFGAWRGGGGACVGGS